MALAGNATAPKISADQLLNKESYVNEFICKLCHNVVDCGPKLTKCSHLFCGDCLQEHFVAKDSSVAPCPVCKTSLHKDSDVFLVEKNGRATCAFLWRMLQELQIKCKAKEPEVRGTEMIGDQGKECPPSPSTCSEIMSTSAIEELHNDGSYDGWSSEGKSESGDDAVFHTTADQVSQGQDLASLIQDLIQVSAASNPESLATKDNTQSAPSIIAKHDVTLVKMGKQAKTKSKKGKETKEVVTCNSTTKSLTSQELQAYQWQVARYQMAYAQQYHMTVQAMRMQQYYQQARLVANCSM